MVDPQTQNHLSPTQIGSTQHPQSSQVNLPRSSPISAPAAAQHNGDTPHVVQKEPSWMKFFDRLKRGDENILSQPPSFVPPPAAQLDLQHLQHQASQNDGGSIGYDQQYTHGYNQVQVHPQQREYQPNPNHHDAYDPRLYDNNQYDYQAEDRIQNQNQSRQSTEFMPDGYIQASAEAPVSESSYHFPSHATQAPPSTSTAAAAAAAARTGPSRHTTTSIRTQKPGLGLRNRSIHPASTPTRQFVPRLRRRQVLSSISTSISTNLWQETGSARTELVA